MLFRLLSFSAANSFSIVSNLPLFISMFGVADWARLVWLCVVLVGGLDYIRSEAISMLERRLLYEAP